MPPTIRRNLTVFTALVLMLAAVGWAVAQYRATQPDASINNGVNSAMGGPPPEAARAMRKLMEARRERSEGPSPPSEGRGFDREAARAAMAEILTPEEQEAMREGMQRMRAQRQKVRDALGPEESRQFGRKIRDRIRQIMRRDGFGPPRRRPEGQESETGE